MVVTLAQQHFVGRNANIMVAIVTTQWQHNDNTTITQQQHHNSVTTITQW
jgi:hypothetical protein